MKFNQGSAGESSDPQIVVPGQTPIGGNSGKPVVNATISVPVREKAKEQDGIEDSVKQYGKAVEAAQRPLPTETGDGTYLEDESNGGTLWKDLRMLGIKDVNTLVSVIKTEAMGKKIDDKTMIMEHVIQVCLSLYRFFRE